MREYLLDPFEELTLELLAKSRAEKNTINRPKIPKEILDEMDRKREARKRYFASFYAKNTYSDEENQ